MNNYYTLIYLNREIKEKIRESFLKFAISPHKDVLHIYLEDNDNVSRLIFSTNARETALFLDKYRPPKKRNVIDFFPVLEGQRIKTTKLADKDRLLSIYFENDMRLLFKLFSGRPNVFLIEGGTIIDAFKNPEEHKGTAPPEPMAPEFQDEVSPRRSAKNQMTEINPLLPRNLLPYLIEEHEVGAMAPEEVKSFTLEVSRALKEDPHPRVLKTGDFCLWSSDWLDLPNEKACTDVNDCVSFAYKNAVHLRRLHQKKEDVAQLLKRTEKKKKEMVKQLRQADKSLERADKYEKYGHLLMAHAHEELPPGQDAIMVEDFYENDDELSIPLNDEGDIAGEAENYYEKAKGARKAYEKATQRLPTEKESLERVQKLRHELDGIERLPNLNSWLKDHKLVLKDLGYGSSEDKQVSSPFRKFKVGKYEVWIGKNAKSNDKLTSRAHKEDIWLHARGVGGSHVVIRMGNYKDYPPKEVILQAAGYAAFYSKAKGMKTAPVMYTKRKYVRKPKGAAPGAVILEREEVEMVPPINPKKH
jgi:predicted ribosome quality control (RQC) complex YloA/Tae2 family protein